MPYIGYGENEGEFVTEENALDYVMEHSGLSIIDKSLFDEYWVLNDVNILIESFFSGEWTFIPSWRYEGYIGEMRDYIDGELKLLEVLELQMDASREAMIMMG